MLVGSAFILLNLTGCAPASVTEQRAAAVRWLLREDGWDKVSTACVGIDSSTPSWDTGSPVCVTDDGERSALVAALREVGFPVSPAEGCVNHEQPEYSICGNAAYDAVTDEAATQYYVGCPWVDAEGQTRVQVRSYHCDLAMSVWSCTLLDSWRGWTVDTCDLIAVS